MSDSGDSPKESILRIMDDFLSHLNQTKKLFMILIFASFAIAPLSIVLVVVILTPPFITHAGQPYEIGVSFVGSAVEDERILAGLAKFNESDIIVSGEIPNLQHDVRIIHAAPKDVVIFKRGNLEGMDNKTAVFLKEPNIRFQYVPADGAQFGAMELPPPPPPRFMYVNAAGDFGRQTDVTVLIVVVVAISAGLAATWLVLGIKEYKFFSKWNQRYSNYKRLQDNLDKELEE